MLDHFMTVELMEEVVYLSWKHAACASNVVAKSCGSHGRQYSLIWNSHLASSLIENLEVGSCPRSWSHYLLP